MGGFYSPWLLGGLAGTYCGRLPCMHAHTHLMLCTYDPVLQCLFLLCLYATCCHIAFSHWSLSQPWLSLVSFTEMQHGCYCRVLAVALHASFVCLSTLRHHLLLPCVTVMLVTS
jgi:hypothetical protein